MNKASRDHLNALELRLSNEKIRLHNSTKKSERDLRKFWVEQVEKEIKSEYKFLGMALNDCPAISDEDLLKELSE